LDIEYCAYVNSLKKIAHFVVPQADATMTGRESNQMFLIGSMNVNIPLTGIAIFGIKSLQP
jgi:hypothetical protein